MREKNHTTAESKTSGLFDYLLVFLLLQIDLISVLLNIRRIEFVTLILVFFVFYRRVRFPIFDSKILIIFVIYVVLASVQGAIWGFSVVSLTTSFTLGFIMPYYFFRVYKINFLFILEKVIYFLTIIALSFWLVHQLIPGAKELITSLIDAVNKFDENEVARSMFFYTYWPALDQDFGISRNAGFRSEPGAFAVFILLAIVINYVRNIRLFDKRNLIYYVAMLSTFSTAGYLALAALGLLLIKNKSVRIFGILLFPIFAYAGSYAYRNLDFMQNKINEQYVEQKGTRLNEPTSGRFLGARKSLNVLWKYPLHGRGLLAMTKPESMSDPEFAEYGWLSEISRFGIVFGCLFMLFFFKGLFIFIRSGGYGIYEILVCSLAIMINLSSQTYISTPFFLIFFFIGLYNYKPGYFKPFSADSKDITTPIPNRSSVQKKVLHYFI